MGKNSVHKLNKSRAIRRLVIWYKRNSAVTSIVDTAASSAATAGTVAINEVSFVSLNLIKRSLFFTRAFNRDFNYTNNPTAIQNAALGSISSNLTGDPSTFITTVGLYNEDNDLMAVAKISPPVKKDFSTEKTFSIRLQY